MMKNVDLFPVWPCNMPFSCQRHRALPWEHRRLGGQRATLRPAFAQDLGQAVSFPGEAQVVGPTVNTAFIYFYFTMFWHFGALLTLFAGPRLPPPSPTPALITLGCPDIRDSCASARWDDHLASPKCAHCLTCSFPQTLQESLLPSHIPLPPPAALQLPLGPLGGAVLGTGSRTVSQWLSSPDLWPHHTQRIMRPGLQPGQQPPEAGSGRSGWQLPLAPGLSPGAATAASTQPGARPRPSDTPLL